MRIKLTIKCVVKKNTVEAKQLNDPLMDFYYLRGYSAGAISYMVGNKYTKVSSLGDRYNSEGAPYFYDTVKAEGWIKKHPCVSTCKADDSFQIIKQEGSVFSFTQLSFNN